MLHHGPALYLWGVTLPGIIVGTERKEIWSPGEFDGPGRFSGNPRRTPSQVLAALVPTVLGNRQPVIHVGGWIKRAGRVSPHRQMEAKVR